MYEILRDFLYQNRRERDEKYGKLENERQTESFINFLQKGGEIFAEGLEQRFVEDAVIEIRNEIAVIFRVIREERRLVDQFHSALDNVVSRVSLERLMAQDRFVAQDRFYDFLNSAFFNQEYFERLQEFDVIQRRNVDQGSPKIKVLDVDREIPRVIDLYFQAQLFF